MTEMVDIAVENNFQRGLRERFLILWKYFTTFLTVLLLIIIDQGVKQYFVINDLKYSYNTGLIYNLYGARVNEIVFLLMIVFYAVILLVLVYGETLGMVKTYVYRFIFLLAISSALSHFYEMKVHGQVVDFILIYAGRTDGTGPGIITNLADIYIYTAGILIVAYPLLEEHFKRKFKIVE